MQPIRTPANALQANPQSSWNPAFRPAVTSRMVSPTVVTSRGEGSLVRTAPASIQDLSSSAQAPPGSPMFASPPSHRKSLLHTGSNGQLLHEQDSDHMIEKITALLKQHESDFLERVLKRLSDQHLSSQQNTATLLECERNFMVSHIDACFKQYHQQQAPLLEKQTEIFSAHVRDSIEEHHEEVVRRSNIVSQMSFRQDVPVLAELGMEARKSLGQVSIGQASRVSAESGALQALRMPLLTETRKMGAEEMVESLKGPSRPAIPWLADVVHSIPFDCVFGVLIVVNSIFLGIEAEWSINSKLEHEPMGPWDYIINGAFILMFTVELCIRFFAFGARGFFCGQNRYWNWFDLVIITSAYPDLMPSKGGHHNNVMFLRVLRLFRLMKLLRVARLAAMMGELRKLLHSIMASMPTLAWSLALMMVILYMFTLLLLQGSIVILDKTVAEDIQNSFMERFGSIYLSMITLYMCAFGGTDWGEIAALLKHAGAGYYYSFLFFIAFMNVAIMNVIMGLFVDAATKEAEKDRIAALKDAADELMLLKAQIFEIFQEFDSGHDGTIHHDELLESYKHPTMKAFLDHIEVDAIEVDALWQWMDSGGGQVNINDFIEGCFRMGRSAKSIDILNLGHKQEQTMEKLSNLQDMLQRMQAQLSAGSTKASVG